jgi:ABC-type glycerol-3-phosphate transport system substrate-binding protein
MWRLRAHRYPAPAQPPTAAPAQPAAPTAAPTAKPVEAAKPVDIELWAQATSTQAPAPPDDWIGFKTIREKLGINLKYVIIPTGADGETKLNAAAAANALPDFFQAVSTTNARNKLIDLNKQGLIAPVDDLLKLMPNRVKTHYNDPTSLALAKLAVSRWAWSALNLNVKVGHSQRLAGQVGTWRPRR